MKENTNIFERFLLIAEHYKLSGVQGLSNELGYKSSEKIYRLNRSEKARPGFDILLDISNKFENLNMAWLISGKGDMILKPITEVSELKANQNSSDLFAQLMGVFTSKLTEAIQPTLDEHKKQIERLADRIDLKEEMDKLQSEIKGVSSLKQD